jgi:hypothetical protein
MVVCTSIKINPSAFSGPIKVKVLLPPELMPGRTHDDHNQNYNGNDYAKQRKQYWLIKPKSKAEGSGHNCGNNPSYQT